MKKLQGLGLEGGKNLARTRAGTGILFEIDRFFPKSGWESLMGYRKWAVLNPVL